MAAFLVGEPDTRNGYSLLFMYLLCCECSPVLSYKKQLFG